MDILRAYNYTPNAVNVIHLPVHAFTNSIIIIIYIYIINVSGSSV